MNDRKSPSWYTPYLWIVTFGFEAAAGSTYFGIEDQSEGFPSIVIAVGGPAGPGRRAATMANMSRRALPITAYRNKRDRGWRPKAVIVLVSIKPRPFTRPFPRPVPLMRPWPSINPRRKRAGGAGDTRARGPGASIGRRAGGTSGVTSGSGSGTLASSSAGTCSVGSSSFSGSSSNTFSGRFFLGG